MHTADINKIKTMIDYDPGTGRFTWLVNRGVAQKGAPAGCTKVSCRLTNRKYLNIGIFNKRFKAHRLAWALVNGEWPRCEIDHIDGDSLNNRISNLRLATRRENSRNLKLNRANSSGFNGVSFCRSRNKWLAQIGVNGKTINLGRYDSLIDAVAARIRADIDNNFHKGHGTRRDYA